MAKRTLIPVSFIRGGMVVFLLDAGESNVQDKDANDRGCFAQLALGCASVCPVIASSLGVAVFIGIGPPGVTGFGVGGFLVFIAAGGALGLSLGDIGCQTDPGTEPKKRVEDIDTGEGVDVTEASSSRPHWYCDQVDQTGDTQPALLFGHMLAWKSSLFCGRIGNRKHTRPQYQPVRPSIPLPPFVQMAMVIAHDRKIQNPCIKCRMFFVRPRLPPDGRGI
jgi:hypothetical protein